MSVRKNSGLCILINLFSKETFFGFNKGVSDMNICHAMSEYTTCWIANAVQKENKQKIVPLIKYTLKSVY